MNYYLLRLAPKQQKITSTAEARSWDVVGIIQSNDPHPIAGLLYYRNNEPDILYLNRTDAFTYDLMIALGIISCVTNDLRLVRAQEISDYNDGVHITISESQYNDQLVMSRSEPNPQSIPSRTYTVTILDE